MGRVSFLKPVHLVGAAVLTLTSVPLLAQAFGVVGGKLPSDYDTTFDHKAGAYDWHVIRPPKPNPEFEHYETNSIKGIGICRVSAFTRFYAADDTVGLMAASNRIHKALNAEFGGSVSYDLHQKSVPSYWTGRADPPESGASDPRGFITFWMEKTGSKMPDGLSSVVSIILPEKDRPERRILVIYAFSNNSRCVETYKASEKN